MPDHLLNLNALHAAAPGVLDAIFGPDGHHPGAPSWIGAVSDYKRRRVMPMTFVMLFSLDDTIDENYVLDCRVPSVAARLILVALKAATGAEAQRLHDLMTLLMQSQRGAVDWSKHAPELAALVTEMAPRIAAAGGAR